MAIKPMVVHSAKQFDALMQELDGLEDVRMYDEAIKENKSSFHDFSGIWNGKEAEEIESATEESFEKSITRL